MQIKREIVDFYTDIKFPTCKKYMTRYAFNLACRISFQLEYKMFFIILCTHWAYSLFKNNLIT